MILVLGNLHWDVVVDAPGLPRLGETLPGSAVDYRFGGKGGNQAVAAARMGARVTMAGRVGRDAAGKAILGELDAAGVDTTRVIEGSAPSGMSVAITEPGGDYGAVIVPGVNDENDGLVALPEDLAVCVLQNEAPEAANLALAASLPPGVVLILNAAPARSVPATLLERTDILVANAVEARDMAGDVPDAAEALQAMGPRAVVVTLGADGLMLKVDGTTMHIPADPVETVSTHGAGDMFTGALAAEIARGASLQDAASFAQTAAGLFVARPLDQRGTLGPDEVRAARP